MYINPWMATQACVYILSPVKILRFKLSTKHCGSSKFFFKILKKIADRGKHVCKSLDGNPSLCVYFVSRKNFEISFQ